jgi:hypothetical protein
MTRFSTIAVAFGVLAPGCNRAAGGADEVGPRSPDGPATPVRPDRAAAAEGLELPDLLFAERLAIEGLADAEAPASSQPIAWDFGRAREIAYDYRQELTVLLEEGEAPETAVLDAALVIEAKGDGTASVVLRDGTMVVDQGETRLEMPTMTVDGVREDGSKADAPDEQWHLALLLTLPGRPLAAGETHEATFAVEQSFGLRARGLILYDLEARAIATARLAVVMRIAGPADPELDIGMTQHHFIELNWR